MTSIGLTTWHRALDMTASVGGIMWSSFATRSAALVFHAACNIAGQGPAPHPTCDSAMNRRFASTSANAGKLSFVRVESCAAEGSVAVAHRPGAPISASTDWPLSGAKP